MSNISDRHIEKIMALALGYSRIFGICNYTYDFSRNRLSFPRRVVAYTIVFDILTIVSVPVCLVYQFRNDQKHKSKNPIAIDIQRTTSVGHAVVVCTSFVWQWTNLPRFKILFKQLTAVRTLECSKLNRSRVIIAKNIVLILGKLLLSVVFVFGTFASVYMRTEKYSVASIAFALYTLVTETVITIVENQFYIGLLYCGFLFELLNNFTSEVVKRILRTDLKRSRRKRLGVIMQKCCALCDELDLISKMHTDIYSLAMTITKLFGIQIFIIIVTTLTTQISLCFYAVIYFGKNNPHVSANKHVFYLSCLGVFLTTVNIALLIYGCSNVVSQCNLLGSKLKLLNSVRRLDTRLKINIELLTIQMKHEILRISLCGMIDVDMKMGFYLTKAALMNFMLLIQSDYKNL